MKTAKVPSICTPTCAHAERERERASERASERERARDRKPTRDRESQRDVHAHTSNRFTYVIHWYVKRKFAPLL